MWSDYFFYLIRLPENERIIQIKILIMFFISMLLIGSIVEYIKSRMKKTLQFAKLCKL